MSYTRKSKLTGALLSGVAALAIVGLSATPAGAATVSGTSFSVTLTGSNGASVTACYTLNPSNLDVNEGVVYTERVHIHGDDQHDTIKSGDDHLDYAYSHSRTFTSTSPVTGICRTKTYTNRDILNEDNGLGQDEIYAKIELVPTDPQLRSVSVNTSIVHLRV